MEQVNDFLYELEDIDVTYFNDEDFGEWHSVVFTWGSVSIMISSS